MGHFIQKLFFALGGFARWIYFMFLNVVFDRNYEKNIGYYLFEEELQDNSGLDSNKKNFVLGIFVFILIIMAIEYFE
ncbi:hypothetical protein [Flavobacterium sp.]|uniref:hypothetical protein n=1 Tax=Flavobacterium sp. TaxID=239 RepID=UPI002614DEC2|nr:hypothetical protein [Flavobacterium sp.]